MQDYYILDKKGLQLVLEGLLCPYCVPPLPLPLHLLLALPLPIPIPLPLPLSSSDLALKA